MKILVGVCGSIAAYRSVDFVRSLKAQGHSVKVVLSESAKNFVSAKVFETFLGEDLLSNNLFSDSHKGTDHISQARWADVILVYGATAHFLAQYRNGLAGDFLLTQLLAFQGEVYLMPAMNPTMWSHGATQENVQALKDRGVNFLGPVSGVVACGEEGVGHLISHEEVFKLLGDTQDQRTTKRSKILLSMGPMRSRLDPVRSLQNHSSGLMGLELLRTFVENGCLCKVLLGPVDSKIRTSVSDLIDEKNIFNYESPQDYELHLKTTLSDVDVFFSAAAVLDFECEFQDEKLGKVENEFLPIRVRPVLDFAQQFGQNKREDQLLVSFSAEVASSDQDVLNRAILKKRNKSADWTLVNRVSDNSGPESDVSDAWILGPSEEVEFLGEALSKRKIARALVSKVLLSE